MRVPLNSNLLFATPTIHALLSNFEFQQLTLDHDVMAIYVGGSRSTGLMTDDSDFDIVVVGNNHFDSIFLTSLESVRKSLRVHFYLQRVDDLFNRTSTPWGHYIAFSQMALMPESNLLYMNDSYKGIIDFWNKNKKECFLYGCIGLYTLYRKEIDEVLKNNAIHTGFYRKILYHLAYLGELLLNESYNVAPRYKDVDFLQRVKTIHHKGISDEDESMVIHILADAVAYVDSHEIDLSLLKDNLRNNFYTTVLKIRNN